MSDVRYEVWVNVKTFETVLAQYLLGGDYVLHRENGTKKVLFVLTARDAGWVCVSLLEQP
ncbi:hypothetical protein UFOVP903_16 [uncultured Caudovirales phage]|uniref:Uncharacterized protein n=1 Tax=uncultured Caudovirales phage TaxID=2100421 RepID=A0A6J5SAI5_9CAUD|nr:hypothetical protein UFOVP903_16 [uncultured Caudovirales phage]CAB4197686.1 hypothetical protein UFOVP1318_30 [uncultured Caudovirales phage]CAB4210418.1 hypothetical protein UFOVP1430_14 [uncultured Caudovirales phage]